MGVYKKTFNELFEGLKNGDPSSLAVVLAADQIARSIDGVAESTSDELSQVTARDAGSPARYFNGSGRRTIQGIHSGQTGASFQSREEISIVRIVSGMKASSVRTSQAKFYNHPSAQ